MTSTDFYSNYAYEGGVFYLENEATIDATSSSFKSNEATTNGGLIYYAISSATKLTTSTSTLTSSKISKITAGTNGGVIYIQNKYINVKLSSTTVSDVYAGEYGGVIYTIDANTITLSNSDFNDFDSPSGAFIYSTATTMTLEIDSSEFEGNSTLSLNDVEDLIDASNPDSTTES